MKRIVAALACGALLVTVAVAQSKPTVTFGEGSDVINVDAISSQLMINLLYGNQPIPYKKHQHASIILQGLAQACMQVAQLVGSNDKKEKQQAVIGILGTVIGTTALLAGSTSNKLPPVTDHSALDDNVARLTEMMLEEIEKSPNKQFDISGAMLSLIKNLPKNDRPAWIKVLLSSTFARQFLKELLLTTCHYLHQHAPEITTFLKQQVKQYLEKQGFINSNKQRQDPRVTDVMVDSMTSAVAKQLCHELRIYMLADLSSEVVQRYLVGQVPTYCSPTRQGEIAAVALVDLIKREIVWLMQYIYGSYTYLIQRSVQTASSESLETKILLFDWKQK